MAARVIGFILFFGILGGLSWLFWQRSAPDVIITDFAVDEPVPAVVLPPPTPTFNLVNKKSGKTFGPFPFEEGTKVAMGKHSFTLKFSDGSNPYPEVAATVDDPPPGDNEQYEGDIWGDDEGGNRDGANRKRNDRQPAGPPQGARKDSDNDRNKRDVAGDGWGLGKNDGKAANQNNAGTSRHQKTLIGKWRVDTDEMAKLMAGQGHAVDAGAKARMEQAFGQVTYEFTKDNKLLGSGFGVNEAVGYAIKSEKGKTLVLVTTQPPIEKFTITVIDNNRISLGDASVPQGIVMKRR
jgi:hypothetical protein